MSEATQQQAASASTSSFVTAIVLNAAVFCGELALFTVLRPRFKAIYEPRSYIPAEDKRMPSMASSLFAWPVAVWKADYHEIKHQNGMDAYVFIRFLRMMVKIMLPIWALSWAVLLPVTAVKTGQPNFDNLDKLTFGNIAPAQYSRYAAHLILAYIFTGWILYNLNKEMKHFITTRQQYLVSPEHSSTAQANTILVTGVPLKYLNEEALFRLFSHLPGGVKKIWLNRDLKELPDLYTRRLKACNKLESAEVKLLATAAKLRRKEIKADAKAQKKGQEISEKPQVNEAGNGSFADTFVPRDKRPTHRLPVSPLPFALPFIGKKVDTIEWAREEIATTSTALDAGREAYDADSNMVVSRISDLKSQQYPPLNSAFVLFNQQIAAHLAAQSLTHNEPYRMAAKYTEVAPADVIWSNLGLNPYEQKIRMAISYAMTAGLIILWAFPVALVGIISNIVTDCHTAPWLAWLCKIPSVVQGIISGILPPVLLAVLTMLLPIILRLFARFEGIPRKTGLELSLMTRFFLFLVIHNFLVVTISSGIISAIPGLVKNPSGIPSLLARQLPRASTFFLTYVTLQGLAGAAGGFLQIVPLIIYYVKLFILGSTPRSVYNIKYDLRDVAWGTLFPSITLIVVISFGYMMISPVINGLACMTFFLFYMMWKYLFLWQLDQPASGDTGGLFLPKAIQHTFVGLYVQQVCLAALFFLHGKKVVAEGALMVVLIVITAGFNIMLNNSYGPLLHSIPLSIADRSHGMQRHSIDEDFDENESKIGEDGVRRRRTHASSSESIVNRPRGAEAPRQGAGAPVAQSDAPAGYGDSVPTEGKRNDGPTDFYHPAAVEPQRIIWLPRDSLGLAANELAEIRAHGIIASDEGAVMNEKGHTEVEGHPPGSDPRTLFG
ncbi:DUF221-domain-containing protein [Sistotremastrum niveocremeum HHB9708]|uniref:DUF221-domain-containing protein n=1 Tax=Sistotremastrum niveocremeum HHB9708 TaxID=1314777 RepID=A0A164XV01_9AGAM|nr:DUF221-domain-containing protein [Sistotremastrum niveocremeum HHB9708]